MIKRIYTRSEPMILVIKITTDGEQTIRLVVKDSEQDFTELTNRYLVVKSEYTFLVRLPLCRKYVDVIIINESTGDDSSFKVESIKKAHLDRRLAIPDLLNPRIISFVRFVQKFCYNAGMLQVNDPNNPKDYYYSKDIFNHRIKYLPTLIDHSTGQEVATPCRVDTDSNVIEVSRKYFPNYTVPMRVGSIFHEGGHIFGVNQQIDNPLAEQEADLDGLVLYLGLGYPRVEAFEVWLQIFEENPTQENMERLALIKRFIDDFERNGFTLFNK